MTYGTLISSVTVGAGGTSVITFSSIPGTYTDLCLVFSGRDTGSGTTTYNLVIQTNGNPTNTAKILAGTGSATNSSNKSGGEITNGYFENASWTSNTFSNAIIYFPNYAGSTNKSYFADVVSENNATAAGQSIAASIYSSTSAITSITLATDLGMGWSQYSTAYLYGLTKGSGGATAA